MTRVVVDAATRSRSLQGLNQSPEFCDESGRLIGYFTPVSDSSELHIELPPLTEEEVRRRLNVATFSTAEVLEHLTRL